MQLYDGLLNYEKNGSSESFTTQPNKKQKKQVTPGDKTLKTQAGKSINANKYFVFYCYFPVTEDLSNKAFYFKFVFEGVVGLISLCLRSPHHFRAMNLAPLGGVESFTTAWVNTETDFDMLKEALYKRVVSYGQLVSIVIVVPVHAMPDVAISDLTEK